MKTTIITGPQGSGKTKKALELIGLGKQFIIIDASDVSKKVPYENIHDNCIIIIDCIRNSYEISQIRSLFSSGTITFRKTYDERPKDYIVSELYLLSQYYDLANYYGTVEHVKL